MPCAAPISASSCATGPCTSAGTAAPGSSSDAATEKNARLRRAAVSQAVPESAASWAALSDCSVRVISVSAPVKKSRSTPFNRRLKYR